MIDPIIRARFEHLLEAGGLEGLCLVNLRRRTDGRLVPVVCALMPVAEDQDGNIELVPLAQMIVGEPRLLYEPPPVRYMLQHYVGQRWEPFDTYDTFQQAKEALKAEGDVNRAVGADGLIWWRISPMVGDEE